MEDIEKTHPSLYKIILIHGTGVFRDTKTVEMPIKAFQKHTRDVTKIREAIFNNCDKKTRYKLLKELNIGVK